MRSGRQPKVNGETKKTHQPQQIWLWLPLKCRNSIHSRISSSDFRNIYIFTGGSCSVCITGQDLQKLSRAVGPSPRVAVTSLNLGSIFFAFVLCPSRFLVHVSFFFTFVIFKLPYHLCHRLLELILEYFTISDYKRGLEWWQLTVVKEEIGVYIYVR